MGVVEITRRYNKLKYALPIIYGVFFLTFVIIYFNSYQEEISSDNNDVLKEAIVSVDKNKKIYITNQINQPYIFWLYYNEISPYDYLEGRVIPNENVMFQQVVKVNNAEFYLPARYIHGINYIIPSSYNMDTIRNAIDCDMKKYNNFTVLDC